MIRAGWKLLLATAITLTTGMASAQQVLKFGHSYETTEAIHQETVKAAEQIAKRTEGRYDVQVFPSSQLGNNNDMDKGLTLGTVDIVLSNNAFAATAYPPIGITQFPYIFRDADHLLAYAKSDTYKKLNAAYTEKTGHQIVATSYFGSRHTISTKLIKTCEELKGLKFRVVPIPAYVAVARACEANPTPITYAEVYLALQNGTVDLAENPLTAMEAMKFFEVAKFIALTGHIVDSNNTVISKSAWAKIAEADRTIFVEELQAAADRVSEAVKQREGELVSFFKDQGLTITEVDRAAFEKAAVERVSLSEFGYSQEDYDAIKAIQ